MESRNSTLPMVDNSELGPIVIHKESHTLRADILLITRALGDAILGGCVDVVKINYKKIKSFAGRNISSRFTEEPMRHSQYLRNKKRFVAEPDTVGQTELDYNKSSDFSLVSEVIDHEEILN
jgi:hypothetical protein